MSELDNLIGKYAYKKYGFLSGLIGRIDRNESGLTKYRLVFKSGSSAGFNRLSDICLYNGEVTAND